MNKVIIEKYIVPELWPMDKHYYFSTKIKNKIYQVKLEIDEIKFKNLGFKRMLSYFREAKNKLKYYIPPERTDCGE